MIRPALLGALVTSLTGCASGCNQPPVPTSEICEDVPNGTRATITSLEVGRMVDGEFAPITEGDTVSLVTGGQGLDMVVARLRVRGTGLSACIPQSTSLDRADGEPVSSESAPIVANQLAPDLWLTGEILLPWYYETGTQARITSHVFTSDTTITFWVGYIGDLDAPLDASPDAPTDASPDA